MPKIQNEGSFDVQITDALFKQLNLKNDPDACVLLLNCKTDDNYEIIHEMMFTNTVISSGNNAGKKVYMVATETLEKLGVDKGYPGNLKQAIADGLYANIKVEWDEYQDKNGNEKRRLRSKWINPVINAKKLDDIDINEKFGAFFPDYKEENVVEPEWVTDTEEPIPFA